MPFGKYKGMKIRDLPDGYLQWLGTLPNLDACLRAAIGHERERRRLYTQEDLPLAPTLMLAPALRPVAEEFISAGLRAMARRYHPDIRGGSHESMVRVTEVAEFFRQQVRG